MITMDLREAIQLQSVYGPSTAVYGPSAAASSLVAQLGQARDSILAFLTAPLPAYLKGAKMDSAYVGPISGDGCMVYFYHCAKLESAQRLPSFDEARAVATERAWATWIHDGWTPAGDSRWLRT